MRCLLVLATSAVVARGLQVESQGEGEGLRPAQPTQPPRAQASRSVLILGCSVDRYAVEWFCGKYENFLRVACTDQARDLAMGFVFHPGVGYHGDLMPPFFNRTRYGNIEKSIIGAGADTLFEHSLRMVGTAQPNMVIVDSSLWDLANWASVDGREDPTDERLQQWCDHDLPNLLMHVKRAFNQSTVVFRTAPQVAAEIPITQTGVNQFSNKGIEFMNRCVKKRSGIGKMLFGQYPVIDYHQLMAKLMPLPKHDRAAKNRQMWLPDGYHPNREPARLYINEILQAMGMPPVEEKDWAQTPPVPAEIPKLARTGSQPQPISSEEPPDWSTNRLQYDSP